MVNDFISAYVDPLMASVWIYLAVYLLAAIDAFFPVVPSESIVITAGVFVGSRGNPELVPLMLVAAAGAFTGDSVSHAIGRFAGGAIVDRWFRPGSKRHGAYVWAQRVLQQRGGLILIVARYIPGGRTATTLTAGVTRFPYPRFLLFTGIAALTWGAYSALVGYLGGAAFHDHPIRGLLVGFGVAVGITILVEVGRYLYHRRARARSVSSHH